MKILVWIIGAILGALTVAMMLTAGWEVPPIDSDQTGFRGTGMVEVNNPRMAEARLQEQLAVVPQSSPPPTGPGPTAGEIYQNVQLLGDLTVAEFNHLKQAWTDWIAPQEGCAYCHQLDNMASDELYTKVVSRRMLEMNWTINEDWDDHVGETAVTCYTCHRGENVPQYGFYNSDAEAHGGSGMLGWTAGQNRPAEEVGLTSLPWDPFSDLIEGDDPIRIVGRTVLPEGAPIGSMQETERTYALMIHMSEALNVNCTYCHNSRNFSTWESSTPERVTSWFGLEMVRQVNAEYVAPLGSILPPERHGPTGEGRKVNCTTCHQGLPQPLGGMSTIVNFPALQARGKTAMSSDLHEEDFAAFASAELLQQQQAGDDD